MIVRELPTYTVEDLQGSDLHLTAFTYDDAVNLGLTALEVITEWDVSIAVDIAIRGDLAFRAKTGGSGPANDPWLAGKAAVARIHGVPSLLVRLQTEAAGETYDERVVDGVTLKAHGGSIPIHVDGEVVATITTSGEPDVVDHAVAAEALRRFIAS